MKFDLNAIFTFSNDISSTKKEIECIAYNLALIAVWTVVDIKTEANNEISKKTNHN